MKKYTLVVFIALLPLVAWTQTKDSLPAKAPVYQLFSAIPLSIHGFTQVRFQSNQQPGQPDGFDIRRARLDFRGQVNAHWEYRLQFELAGTPKLLDGILSYKHRDWLKISAGQFYIPLSSENSTPDNKLLLIDRSQAVNALAARDKDVIGNQNGRDIGVQVSGSVLKSRDRFLADYYLGGFNGAGINTPDNNEAKDIGGRLVFHPLPGLDIGGSYYNGWGKTGPSVTNQSRTRTGAELAYTWKFLTVLAEYLDGYDGKIHRSGYYGILGLFVYKNIVQLAARYDSYDPDLAPDKLNDIIVNYTFGTNLYINPYIKFQFNYTYRNEQGEQVNNDLIAAKLQLSF